MSTHSVVLHPTLVIYTVMLLLVVMPGATSSFLLLVAPWENPID